MIRVLHFRYTALLGRYPEERIVTLFAEHGIEFLPEKTISKEIWQDSERLAKWCNENHIDWVYWGWEKEETNRYKLLYEADRNFRILIFGQEQPQALNVMRAHSPYADVALTSSPIYAREVNGFLPFGVHTYYAPPRIPFDQKQNRILISGSYRHSRGQLFDYLLKHQPFKWPVYLFTPHLSDDLVQKDFMRQIVASNPKYVYRAADTRSDYISKLLGHQNTHKCFIDFTTNSTSFLKFHEDFRVIMQQSQTLLGGYCPERVLDALWMGSCGFCLEDKAVRAVLGNAVSYYHSIEELTEQVNALIDSPDRMLQTSSQGQLVAERFTTEKVIAALAMFFKEGTLSPL
jgi:hypothetical protein